MRLTAVDARISEDTPRDLRGVRELGARLGDAVLIGGRQGPFARTHWRDDLAASEAVLRAAGRRVGEALADGEVPLTLASDCSLALGTLPAIGDLDVLWLDAHADYDTPATQTIDFLGCMSLAGACGAWENPLGSISPGRVVHFGARSQPGDFDHAGQEHARRELRAMLDDPADVLDALGADPVYVHFDPDVLDPADNPVPYGRPDGIRAATLIELAERIPVAGLEVCAFHAQDDPAIRADVAARIVEIVTAFTSAGA
jgi:arginase